MNILVIVIIAISLSMDAFSLSLIYGTLSIKKRDKFILSIIVGLYHFFMPLIGLGLGKIIIERLSFDTKLFVGIVLCLIAIQMIISTIKENDDKFIISIPGYLLFGLSVSIDSLTTGIGLSAMTSFYLLSCLIFAMVSFTATFLGLNLGNVLNTKYGKVSTLVGGILLFVIGLFYIFG